MAMQIKRVNPNGSPKAMMMQHDRIVGGREFSLFTHLIGMMAVSSIPTDQFSPSGEQMARLIEPAELVMRATEITKLALTVSLDNQWVVENPDINDLYGDDDVAKRGF